MAGEELSFEQIRDNFFINPKTNNAGVLGDGLRAGAEALVGDSSLDEATAQLPDDSPLTPLLRQIFDDFSGARRFDHFSVAQLHPAGNIVGTIAHAMSTIANNNTIVQEVSPVETPYERDSIRWMNQHITKFDPDTASGMLTSGGTMANISALLAARRQLELDGWDCRTRVTVLANEMAHYSIKKAAWMIFPRGMVDIEPVPLRADTLKMDTNRLRTAVRRHLDAKQRILAIVGVAGETETGLVEDIETITSIARDDKDNQVFVHVDGAYGAPFVLSRQAALFRGLSEADSVTCDPHKYLYTPYNVGALLFRNIEHHKLLQVFNSDGKEYMFNKDGYNLGDLRLEGSMGGQGAASVYWTIQALGEKGLGRLYDHALDVTQAFADRITSRGILRNIFEPELNTACVIPNSYDPDHDPGTEGDPNFKQAEALLAQEGVYLSKTNLPVIDPDTTTLSHRDVFRFVATHPHTSTGDGETIADMLSDVWKRVINQ